MKEAAGPADVASAPSAKQQTPAGPALAAPASACPGGCLSSAAGAHAMQHLALQRSAGNRAVAASVQLTRTLQREEEKTGIERIREIHSHAWVGPLDEAELERLWGQLGELGAAAYPKDFADSIEYGLDPSNLPDAPAILKDFRATVTGLANDYLDGNLADIAKEEQALGLEGEPPGAGQEAMMTELLGLAERAKQLDELARSYAGIHVGYQMVPQHRPAGANPGADYGLEREEPVNFRPGDPPPIALHGTEGRPAKPYDEVMASYELTMGGLMAVANQSPTIYAALKTGQLGAITGQGEQMCTDPRAVMRTVLGDVKTAIADTKASGIDWEELKPLHAQLLRGDKKAGGRRWDSLYLREIVKDEIGDYETTETLKDVGIGLAAAMAFIFSEVVTGGLATVLWAGAGLGIGAANVARKYDKYEDLKAASAVGTSTATELVEKGQVDAAQLDLILEAAFSFFDVVGIAVKGVKGAVSAGVRSAGAKALEEAAGTAALKGLKGMAPDVAGPLVAKTVDHLGVKGAADAAGMTAEELLKHVPAESAAAGRIRSFLELSAKGVEAAALPDAIRAVAKGGEVLGKDGVKLTADEVVKQAIDTLGFQRTLREAGEWKTLSSALGPTSEAGQRLKAWRDAVYADLKKYIETLRTPADGTGPLAQETGTLENVTNDLDISFLGSNASANKARAAEYLAGRTGLGGGAKELDKMVYIGLFTDPRRMHLFDEFPEMQAKLANRTMKFEEQLIWNDELHQYLVKAAKKETGAEALAEKIAAEMEALGIAKIPGFKPLSSRAVDVLTTAQDELHTAIDLALKSGDTGRAESLIEQLANTQAQINVKEGGGYFSAGGVRKFVTDKENFPGARVGTTAAHDLGAALDQVNKLRKAIAGFEAEALKAPASRDATALAKNIKDLSKYGDRFTAAADVLGSKAPDPNAFAALADEFSEILLQARGATVHSLQQALARNMEGVIAKTRGAVALFDQQHVAILKALRERAAIDGMEDLAPDVIRATKVRYALLTFQSALVTQMGTAARVAGIPVQHSEPADQAEGSEGQGSDISGQAPPQKGDFFVPPKGSPVPV